MNWIFKRLGILSLGLLVPLVFYTPAEDAYVLPQLLALGGALLFLGLAWYRRVEYAELSWIDFVAFVYFAWRLLTWCLSEDFGQFSPRILLSTFLPLPLYAWARWGLAPDDQPAWRAWLLRGAALGAIYGLIQGAGADPLKNGDSFGARAFGTLGNPNFWAGYVVLALPLALGQAFLKRRLFGLIYAMLLSASLIASQTRASWIAALASMLCLAWAWRHEIRPILWARWALFVCLLFLLFSYRNPLHQGQSAGQRLASLGQGMAADQGGRKFMVQIALDAIQAKPWLGHGPEGATGAFLFSQAKLRSQPEYDAEPFRYTQDVHNDFLQVALEAGWPALALLLLLGLSAAWASLCDRDPAARAWGAALVGLGVHACFHFPLAVVPSAALAWVLLGMSASSAESQPWRLPRQIAISLAFLTFVFGIFSLWQAKQLLPVSIALNQGTSLQVAGRHAEAILVLRQAVAGHQRDERVWLRLGNSLDSLGKFEEAQLAFQHAIDLQSALPQPWVNLGLSQGKAGQLDAAMKSTQQALVLDSSNREATANLGKITYMKGDREGAKLIYRVGLKHWPDWTQGHLNLAAILINTNRKREARVELKKVLVLDPQNAEAKKWMEIIK